MRATAAICVLLSVIVPAASAAPLGAVSGLPGATGLALSASGDLYVKSAVSGTVWRVPVGEEGGLGEADAVSADLGGAVRIGFDLAGNLYAIQPGGNVATFQLRRLPDGQMSAQQTRISLGGFVPFNARLAGPMAIENPGGPTSRVFIAVDPPSLYAFTVQQFASGGTTSAALVGNTCDSPRSLAFRPRFGDLIATFSDIVLRLSPTDATCSVVPGGMGFINLQGIAWDNSTQRIFVADSGSGELVGINADGSRYVIAGDLQSPADVAYGSGHVFVAEPPAGRVRAFAADPPPTPTATPTFTYTPTPVPTATFTVTDTPTVTSTRTNTPTATATDTRTITATPSDTPSVTATRTASATATTSATATPTVMPTASPTGVVCAGDCNGNGRVTIEELVLGVRLALDPNQSGCNAFDTDGNHAVTINELIAAVARALTSCGV